MTFWKYLIAVLGGFQYGYTIAIMAGALLFLTPLYQLDAAAQGFVVSSVLIGALIGAASGGMLADYLGRKRAQQLIAGLFFTGALVVSLAFSLEAIVVGRILQGLALGSVSVIAPMYIAEVSPPASRGRNVAYYQLALTFGILVAYGVSYILSGEGAWRWMFAWGTLPAILHGIGFFFLPEPTLSAPEDKPTSWKAVLNPTYRSSLLSALLINVFQQLSGINAIIYFAPSIFELCGFKSAPQAIFSAVLIGGVNFLSTIIALFLIDSKGRKPLLLTGLFGMVVSLSVLALACLSDISVMPWLAIGSLMLYVGCFAFGMGPIPQLMASELFPRAIRSKGVTLAMFSSWICNFFVVFTFMDLTTYFSQTGAFSLYAFICMVAFFFIWKRIPETKGSALH